MTNEIKEVKATKAMKFEDIKAMLNNEIPPYGTTIEEVIALLDKEIVALSRKRKENSEKKAINDNYKEEIINLLMTTPEGMTCSDILKSIPELYKNYSLPKVVSLCTALTKENRITREVKKGKAYFSLV